MYCKFRSLTFYALQRSSLRRRCAKVLVFTLRWFRNFLGPAEMADYKGRLIYEHGMFETVRKMPDLTIAFANETTALLAGYLTVLKRQN